MQPSSETILSDALRLPPQDRLTLADRLYESVHGEFDPSVERAWNEEIERRLRDLEEGGVKPINGEEVMKQVRRIVRRDDE